MQGLPFQTATQLAALVLVLVAGWFFGLATAPGGRKWRERYQDLDVELAGYRDRAETDLREANRRIRDLEAENARLRAAPDAAAPAPIVERVPEPVPVRAEEPVSEPERKGHSTAAVLGAAAAGAALGALAAKKDDDKDDVKVASEARPAHETH